ncbi:hypothetical protein [Pelagibius sp. 7325]|uniref:hypothetical protein n=1 Tax=Pelagibius sp. 7325 TaxID=3131994 RepID=UPI0030ED817E
MDGDYRADIAWNAEAQALRKSGGKKSFDGQALGRGGGCKGDMKARARAATELGCGQIAADGDLLAAQQPEAAHIGCRVAPLAIKSLLVYLVSQLDLDCDRGLAFLGQHIGSPFFARRNHVGYLGPRSPTGCPRRVHGDGFKVAMGLAFGAAGALPAGRVGEILKAARGLLQDYWRLATGKAKVQMLAIVAS